MTTSTDSRIVDALGGNVQGRTLLQKRAFFVTLLVDLDDDLGFDAYFYGPVSSVIDNSVTQLKNWRFIEESATAYGIDSTGFEMKRCGTFRSCDCREFPLEAYRWRLVLFEC